MTSPVTGYSWDFGDGNTSTDENPSNNFVDSEPYRIIYHGSGNTEGTVPIDSTEYYHGDTAIVLGPGGMKKEPYVFYAWTDSPYGYGYIHFPGDELIMLQNRHVYASWVGSSNYIGGLIGKS